MKVNTTKILRKIIPFLFITLTMIHAETVDNIINIEDKYEAANNTPVAVTYQMDTMQLQEKVEKLSLSGELSFEMGLELIKRWTEK